MDVCDELCIKRLVWAIYNRVLCPGDRPQLSSRQSWIRIVRGTYTLIYKGSEGHCPLCTTVMFHISSSRKAPTHPPQSEVRVPLGVTSSYLRDWGAAASLDHYRNEDGDSPFHQYHVDHVKHGSPKQARATPPHCVVPAIPAQESPLTDTLWRTMQWLEECQAKFVEDELIWWLLICPLMNGSDEAMYSLMQRLLATWW